jgi:N-acetylglucosaminyldiphosphoundecaprenol N-acetyl-beta-D-mannosaminyltransferase
MKQSSIIERDVWCVLGLPFDKVNLAQSAEYIRQAIRNKEKCFLSTPNLNFAIASQSDNAFFKSVVDSDLSIADGMPLIWVAKILGIPLVERVAGSTLFDLLLHHETNTGKIKVFFFGGQEGIAELAHQKMNENSRVMTSCGFYDPGFVSVEAMSSPEIINEIVKASPDFIVVALGAKKGQEWIQKNRNRFEAPVVSHLGAVINFVAGHVERAPKLWQNIGMEWLWRIRQEPSLWRRYLFDGLAFAKLLLLNVFPLAIYDRCLKRTNDYRQPINLRINDKDGTLITLSGSFSYLALQPVKNLFSDVLKNGKRDNVQLDFNQLRYMDSAFIATLLLFQAHLNEQGLQMIITHVPDRIARLLRLNNVLNRFQIE